LKLPFLEPQARAQRANILRAGHASMEFPKPVGLETIRAKSCGIEITDHFLPPYFNASSPG
jgi:hypothetical protein